MLAFSACTARSSTKDTASPAVPAKESKQEIKAFGVVRSDQTQNITIDFPAQVEEIHVKEGQTVKKGDVLLALNTSEYVNSIKAQEQELEALESETEGMREELLEKKTFFQENSDPEIKALLIGRQNATAIYEDALSQLQDREVLFKAGALSKHDYNEFKKSVEADKKAADDINASLDVLENKRRNEINSLITSIEKNGHTIEALKTEIRMMREKLNKSYLKKNAIVSENDNSIVCGIEFDKGDIINGTKKVLSLARIDQLYIEADINEEFARDLKIKSKAAVVPLADPSREYAGEISFISKNVKEKNGETIISVRITVNNQDGFLLPGFNVNATIGGR